MPVGQFGRVAITLRRTRMICPNPACHPAIQITRRILPVARGICPCGLMRTAEIDKPAFVTALMARVTSLGQKAVTFGYFEFSCFKSAGPSAETPDRHLPQRHSAFVLSA